MIANQFLEKHFNTLVSRSDPPSGVDLDILQTQVRGKVTPQLFRVTGANPMNEEYWAEMIR